MADIYLAPQDVNRLDAEAVLRFLNRAESAQEIADRIEIPGERDIGIKLGERLLHARAQLNGTFENLGQIYAIALIGPERFTEIVVTLTGKTALQVLNTVAPGSADSAVADLTRQLAGLRQLIQESQQVNQSVYHLELRTVEKTPYLGQIVKLKLRVVDRLSNVSQANMPVTLETNWGQLRYSKGYRVQNGTVINARTGVDGQLTCQLHTPTCEPLTGSQQTELSSALAKLDEEALVPADIEAGFQYLIGLYQHPLNHDLRAAMDIHYKSRQERLLDTVNRSAALHAWNYEQALVRVYLHPSEKEEKATVLAMAALALEYRDWLLPWYQVYKNGLSDKGELNKALQRALNYSTEEKGLTSQMLSNMQTFIAGQNGLLGERVAQQVSQEVVTDFLTDKLDNLSDSSRTTLLTLLREAPSSIRAGSTGQIGVASQAAIEVSRKEGILDMAASLNKATDQLDLVQKDISVINSRVSSMETITSTHNFAQLSEDILTFNKNYSSFQNSYSTFASQLTQLDARFIQFDNELTSFSKIVADFNTTKDLLVTNVIEGVNAALHTLESTSSTSVTIKPINNVNLEGVVITHPPVREP